MSTEHFDFAVLGTNHPEGLFLAAGLSRKGCKVLLVPSTQLGELPLSGDVPLYFPETVGQKRLEDLLFRVGFFRLEEAGLVESKMAPQVILPRNRLTLGKQIRSEFDREFPDVGDLLFRYWSAETLTQMRKVTSQLRSVSRRYPDLRRWIDTSYFLASGRTTAHRSSFDLRVKTWMRSLPPRGSKFFRVHPDLSQPYSSYLVDHAKKWGAKVLEDELKFKRGFLSNQIRPGIRAKQLILNSSAAAKVLVEASLKQVPSRVLYWLYFDELVVDYDQVPEPLEDQSKIIAESGDFDQVRKLSVVRDPQKRQASLRLGTWLPADKQNEWRRRVEDGRHLLQRLFPFLPKEAWKSLPENLELSEEMGDCVRRGHAGRLLYDLERRPRLANWGSWQSPYRVSRHVYAVTPQFLPLRDRTSSLEACFNLMERFSKRRAASPDAVSSP